MNTTERNLEALKDIRKMMDRSSRFISLSGWSGISAGLCALLGIWAAFESIKAYHAGDFGKGMSCFDCIKNKLVIIAAIVFAAAFVSAMFFTYLKSKREGVAIGGSAAKRLLWNTLLPMAVGGILIWKMIDTGQYEFIAPSALLFYGLALINGSKYTMGEVRFLGFGQLVTGVLSLVDMRHPLLYLALGFGVLHMIYGLAMWWRHDRQTGSGSSF